MVTTSIVTQKDPATMIALYSAIHETIERKGAMCVLYATGGIEQKARVIVPARIKANKESDLVICWDSLRESVITLRMDRIAAFHILPVKGVA
jgi:predicted DNA-binding transcriptional regulator YafY